MFIDMLCLRIVTLGQDDRSKGIESTRQRPTILCRCVRLDKCQRLFCLGLCPNHVSTCEQMMYQGPGSYHEASTVPILPGEGQAFPCPNEEEVALSQVAGNQGHDIERLDACGNGDIWTCFPQCCLEPEHGLAETTAHVPEMPQVTCQAEQLLLPLMGLRPLQGGSQVLCIRRQATHPQTLLMSE